MYGDTGMRCGLEALLAVNGIDIEEGQQALYEALRMQCFASVCDVLRGDKGAYLQALQNFRRRMNPAVFAKEMVETHCGCGLDEESYEVLGNWLVCFFRKDDVRTIYPEAIRKRLVQQQSGKCAICGQSITYKSDLDHIIPWIYVGDMLSDNLQLLCRKCNSKKRASVMYPLQVLLKGNGNKQKSRSGEASCYGCDR